MGNQKIKLRGFLEQAQEKVLAYKTANPEASNADIVKAIAQNRDQMGEQVVKFLRPDQSSKWDLALKNVKEFLGEKLAA